MNKLNKIFRLPRGFAPGNDKKRAFTLSEVLLTLTALAILMAITIPTLYNNVADSGLAAQLKKTYGQLDQATSKIMMNNSGTLDGAFTNVDDMVTKYCSALECSKKCGSGAAVSGGCFNAAASMKILNGGAIWYAPTHPNDRSFVLADGTLVLANLESASCASVSNANVGSPFCAWLEVDVNGFKGPNTYGKDIFEFILLSNKLLPEGQQGNYATITTYCNPANAAGGFSGIGCAAKVLNEGAINY